MRYQLFDSEGNDQGEADCTAKVGVADKIRSTDGRSLRVVDVVLSCFAESDKYVGLLMVEPA